MRSTLALAAAAALATGLLLLAGCAQDTAPSPAPAPEPGKRIDLDLDTAAEVALPATAEPLEPESFRTPDGREGWVVKLPQNLPLATPAYADGMVFVGGGYGSHDFYAFDAKTGALVWRIQTGDDGPTAAVVEDGCVAFNTESCTVIVAEAKTGKILWQEWLGDPLMSQPAIWKGRLYVAYPAGQGKQGNEFKPVEGYGYRLLCADLRTE